MYTYKTIKTVLLATLFFASLSFTLYAENDQAQLIRVYVAEPAVTMQNGSDSGISKNRYTPIALSLSDMIGFTLTQLDQYEVYTTADFSHSSSEETPESISTTEEARSLSEQYGIDNVIFGTIEALEAGGTKITLSLFDRYENQVTVVESSRTASILDTFDAADHLSVALLEGFSGVRISFGNIHIKNIGIDGTYLVELDEKRIGNNITHIDNLLVGTHEIKITHTKNNKKNILLEEKVEIHENKTHTIAFSFPALFPEEKKHLLSLDNEIHRAYSIADTQRAATIADEALTFSQTVYAAEVKDKYTRLIKILERPVKLPSEKYSPDKKLYDVVEAHIPETKMMSSANLYFSSKVGTISDEDLRYAVGKNLFNAALRSAHYISEEKLYHPTINVTLPDYDVKIEKIVFGLTDKDAFEESTGSRLHSKQVVRSNIFWNNNSPHLSRDIAPPNITFPISSIKKYGHIVMQFFYTKGDKSYSHYETIQVEPFTEHSSAPKITSKSSIDGSTASIEVQWSPSPSASIKQQQIVISKTSNLWPHPQDWAYEAQLPSTTDSAIIKLRKQQPNTEYRAHICTMDKRGHWSWISGIRTFTLP